MTRFNIGIGGIVAILLVGIALGILVERVASVDYQAALIDANNRQGGK